jgi:hypothetical protein
VVTTKSCCFSVPLPFPFALTDWHCTTDLRDVVQTEEEVRRVEDVGMWANKKQVLTADARARSPAAFVQDIRRNGLLLPDRLELVTAAGEEVGRQFCAQFPQDATTLRFANTNEHHGNLPLHVDHYGVLPGHPASDSTPGPGDGFGDCFASVVCSYHGDGRGDCTVLVSDVENLRYDSPWAVPIRKDRCRVFHVKEGDAWGCLPAPAGTGARHRTAHGVSVSNTVYEAHERVNRRVSLTYRFMPEGGLLRENLENFWDTFTLQ